MAQRRRTDLRLRLEVGLEPRRDGQDALTGAYLRITSTEVVEIREPLGVWG